MSKKRGSYQGIYIPLDGPAELVDIPYEGSYEFLREKVEGCIEFVGSGHDDIYFVGNDEAKLIGMEINHLATGVWYHYCPDAQGVDVLCGPIVIVGGADAEGETKSVDPKVIKFLRDAAFLEDE